MYRGCPAIENSPSATNAIIHTLYDCTYYIMSDDIMRTHHTAYDSRMFAISTNAQLLNSKIGTSESALDDVLCYALCAALMVYVACAERCVPRADWFSRLSACCHICAGTRLAPATSAPGLAPPAPPPHLHRVTTRAATSLAPE